MGPKSCLGAVLLAAALTSAASLHAGEVDRLDRFRAFAAGRLAAAQLEDGAFAAGLVADLYVLLDEEILESLGSGGVFASMAFLQERLDGFAEAWGGASMKLTRVGRLTVGAFQLGEGGGGSVRVYGRTGGEATLLAAVVREGRPATHALPALPDGAAQFLVTWDGAPSGRGTRALRADLFRQRGDDIRVAWTTAELFPEGLIARHWRVRNGELRVRYELHYPGWRPGCQPQTEQEDVYRVAPGAAPVVRANRQRHAAWQESLHRRVAALLKAVDAGDRPALGALVPDAGLRQRLPSTLALDSACDAPDPPGAAVPASVSVAVTAAEGRPWTLTWRRTGPRWWLAAAGPVLQ